MKKTKKITNLLFKRQGAFDRLRRRPSHSLKQQITRQLQLQGRARTGGAIHTSTGPSRQKGAQKRHKAQSNSVKACNRSSMFRSLNKNKAMAERGRLERSEIRFDRSPVCKRKKKKQLFYETLNLSLKKKKSVFNPSTSQFALKENQKFSQSLKRQIVIQNFLDRQFWNREFIFPGRPAKLTLSTSTLLRQFRRPPAGDFFGGKARRPREKRKRSQNLSLLQLFQRKSLVKKKVHSKYCAFLQKTFTKTRDIESHFAKKEELGRGCYSVVHLVRHAKSGAEFAMKSLHLNDFLSKAQLSRLLVGPPSRRS